MPSNRQEMTDSANTQIHPMLSDIRGNLEKLNTPVNIMEVCGTHTVAIRRSGVLSLLPEHIRLVSGPGCPVCVTPSSYIANALELIENHDVVIASFGDMLKVPAPDGRSLASSLSSGSVKMIYSPAELPALAAKTDKDIVFLGIGFETTIPTVAAAFLQAAQKKIGNLFLYSAFKLVPPALKALLQDEESVIDGFLLPGHVSVVIGTEPYRFISETYRLPGAVAGFEGIEIIKGIASIVRMLAEKSPGISNEYSRVVRERGNAKARETMNALLQPADSLWRGFGVIPDSGMELRPAYRRFDAAARFELAALKNTDSPRCLCGAIIQGKALPTDCTLFGTGCTPSNPSGPCMVSLEGTCSAYYQYGGEVLGHA